MIFKPIRKFNYCILVPVGMIISRTFIYTDSNQWILNLAVLSKLTTIYFTNFQMQLFTIELCKTSSITNLSLSLQITLPQSFSKRDSHSLSSFMMGPHCVWLVTVGGYSEGLTVSAPNVTMLTELGKQYSVITCPLSFTML